jgi:hypothetical protein
MLLALVCPVLFAKRELLWNYYVVNCVLGPDKEVRAAELGVQTRAQALLYYVRSVANHHAGRPFLLLAALGGGLAVVFGRATAGTGFAPTPGSGPGQGWTGPIFLGVALAVPFAVLTAGTSKSPVVGSILVPPLLLLALLPVRALARSGTQAASRALLGLAVLAIACGAYVQVRHARHRGRARPSPESAAALAIHDEIITRCRAVGRHDVVISVDTVHDLLTSQAFGVVAFERHGAALEVSPALGGSVLETAPERALACLRSSDFVVLTDGCLPEVSAYPFTHTMQLARPRLIERCERELLLVKEVPVASGRIRLYARRELARATP